MYSITKLLDNRWLVECRIQDGTERWHETSRETAVHSLISGARILNNSYIHENEISFYEEEAKIAVLSGGKSLSSSDEQLLSDIKNKRKVVLDFDDFRLKYRITKEECEKIVAIREGRLTVS